MTFTLGDVVRKLRVRKGLTQPELAEKADVDKSVIVRLEKGRNTERLTVEKVAKALGVPVLELYASVPPADDFLEIWRQFDRLQGKTRDAFRLSILQAISEQLKIDERG